MKFRNMLQLDMAYDGRQKPSYQMGFARDATARQASVGIKKIHRSKYSCSILHDRMYNGIDGVSISMGHVIGFSNGRLNGLRSVLNGAESITF